MTMTLWVELRYRLSPDHVKLGESKEFDGNLTDLKEEAGVEVMLLSDFNAGLTVCVRLERDTFVEALAEAQATAREVLEDLYDEVPYPVEAKVYDTVRQLQLDHERAPA